MRRKEIGLICSSLVLLLVSLPAPLHSQTSEYRVIRIDEPIALHNWPHAALNDSSSVVGVGYRGPFLWKNGAVTMLAQPDACLAYAPFDLNNQGVAVGFGSNCSSLLAEALRWTATSCFNIGGLADNVQSAAYGINGSGKITGSFLLASSDLTVFVYDGSLNFLPILGTGYSINDSDYVVGQRIQQVSGLSVGTGFLYRNGNIIDLPGFGAACGINNRNQVIGTDNDASAGGGAGAGTGLLWENGDVTVLGTSIIPCTLTIVERW